MTLTNMNIKLFCATTESDEPRILKGGFWHIKTVMYANVFQDLIQSFALGYLKIYRHVPKGYARAIAGIWGREGGGGVGEGLPELKFSSIILSFKTSRRWSSIVYYLSTQFPWSEGCVSPNLSFACIWHTYLTSLAKFSSVQ